MHIDFWEANLLKNIDFYFGLFLMHQTFRAFTIESLKYTFRCTLRIYIVLYGYKLSLTSYADSKIRKKAKFLQFFSFLRFKLY